MGDEVTEDRELVQQMLAGEERAFSEFFTTYFPRVFRFALPRVNRNEDDAKDVVQATLVKAMRKLGDYRGEAAMFTWLCQICRREIANHVRSERRYSDKVVLIEDSEEVRAALESIEAPAADDPLRRCDGAELKRLVHAVLDRLLNLFDRHAVGFLHLATVLVDDGQQFSRHR